MRCARFCLSLLVALALTGMASAAPRNPRLRSVHTLAFAIGDCEETGNLVSRYAGYDLLVLDGQEATAALREATSTKLSVARGHPIFESGASGPARA